MCEQLMFSNFLFSHQLQHCSMCRGYIFSRIFALIKISNHDIQELDSESFSLQDVLLKPHPSFVLYNCFIICEIFCTVIQCWIFYCLNNGKLSDFPQPIVIWTCSVCHIIKMRIPHYVQKPVMFREIGMEENVVELVS